jgi:hypothetical protein
MVLSECNTSVIDSSVVREVERMLSLPKSMFKLNWIGVRLQVTQSDSAQCPSHWHIQVQVQVQPEVQLESLAKMDGMSSVYSIT